jgi:predicted metalloprotease
MNSSQSETMREAGDSGKKAVRLEGFGFHRRCHRAVFFPEHGAEQYTQPKLVLFSGLYRIWLRHDGNRHQGPFYPAIKKSLH